jgi:hypothetical protein
VHLKYVRRLMIKHATITQQLLSPASILPQNIMLEITNQIDSSTKHKPATVFKKPFIKL